jgi:hypothetical protein
MLPLESSRRNVSTTKFCEFVKHRSNSVHQGEIGLDSNRPLDNTNEGSEGRPDAGKFHLVDP